MPVVGSDSAPYAARKLTVPLPAAPLASTALAVILTLVPSLSTEVADGLSVSEGVGPVPPLELPHP